MEEVPWWEEDEGRCQFQSWDQRSPMEASPEELGAMREARQEARRRRRAEGLTTPK